MPRTLTWLHLSDLHYRNWDSWDSNSVVSALIEDFRKLGIRPDLIFFTGDLVYGSAKGEKICDQFEKATVFLDSVRNAFSPPLSKECLYIVPGNHDVDREEISSGEQNWIRDSARTEIEIIDTLQNAGKQCRVWMDRLNAYRAFLNNYGLVHLRPDDLHLLWTDTKTINGVTVGLLGYNSAWSCSNSDEKARLWSGLKWQIGHLEKQLGNVDFKISLIHHPCNWLNQNEDPYVRRYLAQSTNILLHGHEHQSFVEKYSDHVTISSGACYECSWMENGYSIGMINFDDAILDIHLRSWDKTGRGWVSRNIAASAPSGIWSIRDLSWLKKIRDTNLVVENNDDVIVEASSIINISKSADPKILENGIHSIRRRPILRSIQHELIRSTEIDKFVSIMLAKRFAWLVSDWQMGKEGFLGECLNKIGQETALENVYRIQCGDACSTDEVFNNAQTQIGRSFVEFAEIIRILPEATIIFDDVSQLIGGDSQNYNEILTKIDAILDFSPNVKIVIISRQDTRQLNPETTIILKSLDVTETKLYLENHPKASDSLKVIDVVERLHAISGGLPGSLDRLVAKNEYLTITQILKDELATSSLNLEEPVPRDLVKAVESLQNSIDKHERRSFDLLTLLTVLRDGETFKSIRYFYRKSPFYEEDVGILVKLGLVEAVLIAQTGNELLPANARNLFNHDPARLLRVPRQVRDFVNSFISDELRSKIYHIASDSFFGQKWSQGKITLRRSLFYAYQDSSILGPGNELIIAQFFLRSALEGNRQDRIEKYANLALGYCAVLRKQDRFRDLLIASGTIMEMLEDVNNAEYWATAAHMYGLALRMTSREAEAIKILEEVRGKYKTRSNSFECSILFELSSAYKAEGEKAKSILLAKRIIEIEDKNSPLHLQAQSIIAKLTLTGIELGQKLKDLYLIAKNNGHQHAANNIALDLVKLKSVGSDSIKYLNSVITSSRDAYNRTRAINEKAKILREAGLIDSLTVEDREMLCAAYAYSYSQRINSLMDSCHDSLWNLYYKSSSLYSLLRLFRFSSFVWRLGKQEKREFDCLKEICALNVSGYVVHAQEIEIVYLENRKINLGLA